MIINVHVLRNYSANVVNRGEDGEPKSLVFGGKKRTRVSSQSRKHKWRTSDSFRKAFTDGLIGIRTRKVGEITRDELQKEGYSDPVALRAGIEVTRYLSTAKSKKKIEMKEEELVADTIRTYSQHDIDTIIEHVRRCLTEEEAEKKIADIEAGKDVKNLIDFDGIRIDWLTPIDTALFGRMVASDPAQNVPAAVYVAHAFSTHASADEVDFFTATDDLAGISEDTGAAHMGNISFDTACMYEYSYIDMDILSSNLKDIENRSEVLKKTIEALIPAIVLETPDGKQTTMASRPAPSAVLIEVQNNKQVFDYANAFADAVWQEPIVKNSACLLKDECRKANAMFGEYRDIEKTIWLSSYSDIDFEEAVKCSSLSEMINEITALL